jgi:CRISPR-associated protein Cas2
MYLIVYDISDSRRLQKMAKTLESYGVRVQNSTFEADLTNRVFKELKRKIRESIEPEEDRVFIFKFDDEKQDKKSNRREVWEMVV